MSYRFSEAYSGLSLELPELDNLRELVRTEAIDVVVCYSIDRLTRDPGHGVIITQELEKHRVTTRHWNCRTLAEVFTTTPVEAANGV